ncbi:hypothetical protein PV328_002576 [Microctonus aethiopoides]|uniref:Uncharacterized protein n=1 Tax=Microctonus aethiopoides TaxID=144406 RepID=A0AA39F6R7_9HYME|nr:hypothetical protein PV328_002576 [Microctonus aethiopoides]
MGAMAGGVSGVPASAVSGGLQNASMAGIELGKKRMRDTNDDLLMMDSKSFGSFYYENFAFPGMVPYKRPAGDKSGMPVYQATGATTYQQLMQLPQPFVPVSCEYAGTPPLPHTSNQSIANTQNSIPSQASSSTNDANGVLVDPNNPPPPPPSGAGGGGGGGGGSGGGNDGKQITSNHENENIRNSPELNHTNPPQVSQLAAHSVTGSSMSPMASSIAGLSLPNVSNLTSMANMVSMANMSSIASIASIHQANSMANYTMANMAHLNVLNTLGMAPNFSAMDPATLAKEVAQKNYARAIKLSQASQQYGINPLSALNYTGVTLNKQALTMSQQNAAAVAAAGVSNNVAAQRQLLPPTLAGIHGAALASNLPAGLLHYPRPPTAAQLNPYSLIRQHPILPSPYVQASLTGVPSAAAMQQTANPYIQNPYAMLPGMAVHGVPGVTAGHHHHHHHHGVPQMPTGNPATIAAQPQVAIPVSSGVIMQPYKKMKTT